MQANVNARKRECIFHFSVPNIKLTDVFIRAFEYYTPVCVDKTRATLLSYTKEELLQGESKCEKKRNLSPCDIPS